MLSINALTMDQAYYDLLQQLLAARAVGSRDGRCREIKTVVINVPGDYAALRGGRDMSYGYAAGELADQHESAAGRVVWRRARVASALGVLLQNA